MKTFFQWLMNTPVTIGTLKAKAKPKAKPKRTKRTIKEVYNKR